MTDDPRRLWQRLTDAYLKRVAKALDQTGHSRRAEVLADVKIHLDTLYDGLPVSERTQQRMESMIQEMGSPACYAEMLAPDEDVSELRSLWRRPRVRHAAWLLIAVLVAAAVFLWPLPLRALPGLNLVLRAMVVAAVVIGYLKTRNSGFIYLGVAIVILPIVWSLLWVMVFHPLIQPEVDHVGSLIPRVILPEFEDDFVGSLFAVGYFQKIVRDTLILAGLYQITRRMGILLSHGQESSSCPDAGEMD